MLLLSVPSVVTKAHRPALAQQDDICAIISACNVDGGAKSNSGGSSPLINSDFIFFSILLVFGITNGHVTSVSMMAAASLEHNKRLRKEEVDTAAVVAQFSLAAGLVLGSIANFGIRARICNCNPFLH